MKVEKGSFEMMRHLNQQIVLQQIRDFGPISRADIAKRTQLTPPTVSKVVMELLEAGFVLETEIGESNGGRRPILLCINPQGGYIVGLSITASDVKALVTDLEIRPVAQTQRLLPATHPEEVCILVADVVQQVIAEAGVSREQVLGVGIALHGLVDHSTGVSIFAPHLQWRNWPIKHFLEEKLGLPVRVDNDVRLMAAGEMWRGAARDSQNFAYIHVDYGVGTGIVLNGQLLRGANHAAGEIGHMQMEPDGPRCSCGKQGCLESLISLSALQDLECDSIRQIVVTYLGRGIAVIMQLLDLRKVILGGRVLGLDSGIYPAIQKELQTHILPESLGAADICLGQLGSDASIIGAITLILSDFYQGGNLT